MRIQTRVLLDDQTELSIVDTGAWTGPRTLDHLVDFIVKGL